MMRSHANPDHAARLRAVRAEEDAALAVVNARSDSVTRARTRRAQAAARYDRQVEQAELELTEAIGALVQAAGLDRSVLVLGIPRSTLKRMLRPGKPKTAARMSLADESGGGQ